MVDGIHEVGMIEVDSSNERPQALNGVVVKAMVCFEDCVHEYSMSEAGLNPKCTKSTINHSQAGHGK